MSGETISDFGRRPVPTPSSPGPVPLRGTSSTLESVTRDFDRQIYHRRSTRTTHHQAQHPGVRIGGAGDISTRVPQSRSSPLPIPTRLQLSGPVRQTSQ